MKSLWSDEDARAAVDRWGPASGEELALRVYTSRLLGRDPTLVLHGGGNTSVKATGREITGEEVPVIYVKGSGWDLASIEPAGFPACRMGPLERCLALPALDDESMVKALRSQMLDPQSPTPSVEALLHAFLPGRYVDHTHANAVLTVVDQPDGASRAQEVWGDDLVFVPYVMPGFGLARRVAELGDRVQSARVMVLDKHGIFTWGDTARESYERMIDAVDRAEQYVARKRSARLAAGSRLSPEDRRAGQRALSPIVRGALARAADGTSVISSWRDDHQILALLERKDGKALTEVGPMTPDHVIRTKPVPAWLGEVPADSTGARAAVEAELSRYAAWYGAYFDEHAGGRHEPLTRLDRLPRVLLAPGLGALTIGKALDEAVVAGDIYAHTASVIGDAADIGRYEPVSRADLFDVEYWSLEQAKLKVGKSVQGPLARKIAVVTGAARGIGRATAEHFLDLGAHVVFSDASAEALTEAVDGARKRHGRRVAEAVADVTRAEDCVHLMATVVDAFGGLDIVVSNAGNAPSGLLHTEAGDAALHESLELNLLGHQNVARVASQIFLSQGMGGCLLFNASKSAFNPGREFGPYAVPKAALIALMRQYAVDLGAQRIRANAVNADRIRTALFDGIVEARAKARGVSPDDYFRDNLLQRETTAADVARAFGFLATAEATTGSIVTVDGGNAAAFPR